MNAIKLNLDKFEVNYVYTNIPKITNPTDVIIRTAYSGICGTDLHIIEGQFPAKNHVILGHEICGFVHEISEECTAFQVGNRVVVNPNRSCNICIQCRRGKPNICINDALNTTIGIGVDGGWAEYCKVPVYLLSKVPSTIPLQLAVLCEPLSCIIHGLDKISTIKIGENVVILGAGIIGVLFLCVLHLMGNRNIYVSEPNEKRRKYINNLNMANKCLKWSEIEEYRKENPDWQIDICIDCSGSEVAMQAAVPLLRPGGKMCIFGVASQDASIRIRPFEMFWKDLSIISTVLSTTSSFDRSVGMLESLVNSKYLSFEKLGIATYSMDKYKEALNGLKSGSHTKVVFDQGSHNERF